MTSSQSSHQQRIDRLQADRDRLTDEYQDMLRQFDCTLAGSDRTRLEGLLASLDRQLGEIERELRTLQG